MSVNKVTLVGRLTKDPQLSYTPSGAACCKFDIATSESWKDKQGQQQERTEFHNCESWGKSSETYNTYLHKGKMVYVEGSLETQSWDDKKHGDKRYKTVIKVRKVDFLEKSEGVKADTKQAPKQDYKIKSEPKFTSDEIPF